MTDHMYMESSDVLYSLYFKNQLMVGPVRGKCLRLGIVTTSEFNLGIVITHVQSLQRVTLM